MIFNNIVLADGYFGGVSHIHSKRILRNTYVKTQKQDWEFRIFKEDLYESKLLSINLQPGIQNRTPLNSYSLTKESVPEALKRCLPNDVNNLAQIARQIRNFGLSFRKLGFDFETSNLSQERAKVLDKLILEKKKKELIEADGEFLIDCEMLHLLDYRKKRTIVTLDSLLYIYLRACNLCCGGVHQ